MELAWIWVAVLVLAIAVEALTDQLVSIWFVPSSIVATILDFCEVKPIWQIIIFLLVSAVGIVFSKTILTKFIPKPSCKTNIDAIIGEKCVVTERVDNYAGCGQAKVKGQVWSVRSVNDDEVFECGEVLNVVAIEGVKLICRK